MKKIFKKFHVTFFYNFCLYRWRTKNKELNSPENDVTYVNIDVLENKSDFERYRNCDGIIPEETIKSAHRECHFNNPEFGWGVPGK